MYSTEQIRDMGSRFNIENNEIQFFQSEARGMLLEAYLTENKEILAVFISSGLDDIVKITEEWINIGLENIKRDIKFDFGKSRDGYAPYERRNLRDFLSGLNIQLAKVVIKNKTNGFLGERVLKIYEETLYDLDTFVRGYYESSKNLKKRLKKDTFGIDMSSRIKTLLNRYEEPLF